MRNVKPTRHQSYKYGPRSLITSSPEAANHDRIRNEFQTSITWEVKHTRAPVPLPKLYSTQRIFVKNADVLDYIHEVAVHSSERVWVGYQSYHDEHVIPMRILLCDGKTRIYTAMRNLSGQLRPWQMANEKSGSLCLLTLERFRLPKGNLSESWNTSRREHSDFIGWMQTIDTRSELFGDNIKHEGDCRSKELCISSD